MLCDRADVAQLVEQLIRNEQVVGSIPIISSSVINASEVFGGFFVALGATNWCHFYLNQQNHIT